MGGFFTVGGLLASSRAVLEETGRDHSRARACVVALQVWTRMTACRGGPTHKRFGSVGEVVRSQGAMDMQGRPGVVDGIWDLVLECHQTGGLGDHDDHDDLNGDDPDGDANNRGGDQAENTRMQTAWSLLQS